MSHHLRLFEGENANETWFKALQEVALYGAQVPSRVSPTREVHPAVLTVYNPLQPVVTAEGRPINIAFALAEVLWILQGSDEVEMLQFYNSRISQYSDDGDRFNAAYGHRLRHAHGHDQIDDIIRLLKEDPETRQAVLNIWLPSKDRAYQPMRVVSDTENYSFQDVKRDTKDRACNIVSHLMIRDGKMDWLQILRSNDIIHGTPYNFIQWMTMQTYIAAAVGVPVGEYTHVADSLHMYDYHFSEAESVRPFDLYSLGYNHAPLAQEDTNLGVMALVTAVEKMIRDCQRPDELNGMWANIRNDLPPFWRNVCQALIAFAAYKMDPEVSPNRDRLATFFIRSMDDKVYALSLARFMYHHRWSKPGHEDVAAEIFTAPWLEPFAGDDPFMNGDLRAWITLSSAVEPVTSN